MQRSGSQLSRVGHGLQPQTKQGLSSLHTIIQIFRRRPASLDTAPEGTSLGGGAFGDLTAPQSRSTTHPASVQALGHKRLFSGERAWTTSCSESVGMNGWGDAAGMLRATAQCVLPPFGLDCATDLRYRTFGRLKFARRRSGPVPRPGVNNNRALQGGPLSRQGDPTGPDSFVGSSSPQPLQRTAHPSTTTFGGRGHAAIPATTPGN